MDALGILSIYDPSSLRKLKYLTLQCTNNSNEISVPSIPFLIVFTPWLGMTSSNPIAIAGSTIIAPGTTTSMNVASYSNTFHVYLTPNGNTVRGTTDKSSDLYVSCAYPVLTELLKFLENTRYYTEDLGLR